MPCYLGLAVASPWLVDVPELRWPMLLIVAGSFGNYLVCFSFSGLRGAGRPGLEIVAVLVTSVITVSAALLSREVVTIAWALLAVGVVNALAVVAASALAPELRPRLPDLGGLWPQLKKSLPYLVIGTGSLWLGTADILLVRWHGDSTAVGLLQSGTVLLRAGLFGPWFAGSLLIKPMLEYRRAMRGRRFQRCSPSGRRWRSARSRCRSSSRRTPSTRCRARAGGAAGAAPFARAVGGGLLHGAAHAAGHLGVAAHDAGGRAFGAGGVLPAGALDLVDGRGAGAAGRGVRGAFWAPRWRRCAARPRQKPSRRRAEHYFSARTKRSTSLARAGSRTRGSMAASFSPSCSLVRVRASRFQARSQTVRVASRQHASAARNA